VITANEGLRGLEDAGRAYAGLGSGRGREERRPMSAVVGRGVSNGM
jgi:hypothetical protein